MNDLLNSMNGAPWVFIIPAIMIGIGLFILLRTIFLWYFKIFEIVEILKNISKALQKICESKDRDLKHE